MTGKSKTISLRGLESNLRRRLRSERGSALVETALGMTIFLAVFFGVIQFSFALYAYNWVSEAAREGSRWAIVRGSTCYSDLGSTFCDKTGASSSEITSYVKGLGYPGLTPSNISVSTSWYTAATSSPSSTTPQSWSSCSGSGCNTPGNQVQVTVSYSFPLGIPFWKTKTLNLSSSSQMVIVQ